MPNLETPLPSPINQREARDAHAKRLVDRIGQYKSLLSLVPASATKEHPRPEMERSMIQDAIALHQQQLDELHRLGPVPLAKSDQELATLKDEVASLREALNEATAKLSAKQESKRAPDAK